MSARMFSACTCRSIICIYLRLRVPVIRSGGSKFGIRKLQHLPMTPCMGGLIATMVLISFILVDHDSWSRSRVDTCSFQNVLEMIQQSSSGDDHFLPPIPIIMRAGVVMEAIVKLYFHSGILGDTMSGRYSCGLQTPCAQRTREASP
jgi:hypothetical protein